MSIILNNSTFNNGGTATENNTSLNSIYFGNTEVWKKETTETGTMTVKGYAEPESNITYTHGWYSKSFDIPTGQTFRLNNFGFDTGNAPLYTKAEIYANGTLVASKSSGQNYTWYSGAKPSSSGTYTSTRDTGTLVLKVAMAINEGIWSGEYTKTFNYSVYIS